MDEVTGKQPPDRSRSRSRARKRVRNAVQKASGLNRTPLAVRGSGPKNRRPAKSPTAVYVRVAGRSWLLRMALRALHRALRKGPKDFRNHGFKGVKRPNRTGLAGR